MPDKREVLSLLTRNELLDALAAYGLDVAGRRIRDQFLNALAHSKKARLAEILGGLSRERLIEICRELGRDDGGREKALLIERILSGSAQTSEPRVAARGQAGQTAPGGPKKQPALPFPGGAEASPPNESPWQRRGSDAVNNNELETHLWDMADELRANSKLKASEYSVPVLGLIFLRFADHRFSAAERDLTGRSTRRRQIGPADFHARGVLYLPNEARFGTLLNLPEGAKVGQAINDAMKAIEEHNADLKDVLPKTFNRFEKPLLVELLRLMNSIPMDIEGDAFGKIYEYFLGNFAKAEGSKGGEFFTPTSIVKLIVEILEPFHGRIFDPACGSGGMFVQSARFVQEHKRKPSSEISIYGQERLAETVRLAKMNLAVHGLAGDIRQGNTYYEDLHTSVGKFDFVLANPPFNVDRIDKERLAQDRRFPLGLPRADNGNYIWIQVFRSALNESGRAGFVMANSASDARGSELEIRKQLIQDRAIDVMVTVGPNFFYTVTLPCTLWFLDRGKRGSDREKTLLFLDARHIFQQIDRAHRDFAPDQLEFLANIVRLYRGEETYNRHHSALLLAEKFPDGKYMDVPGLCKVATLKEIEARDWSLNPGRYVGVGERAEEDLGFMEHLQELNEKLECLNAEARDLEERVGRNLAALLVPSS